MNLTETQPNFKVYGTIPSATSYYVIFNSQLSNSDVYNPFNDSFRFDLNNINLYETWFEFDIDISTVNKDELTGYYVMKLYARESEDVLVLERLVKFINPNKKEIPSSVYDGGQNEYKTFNG